MFTNVSRHHQQGQNDIAVKYYDDHRHRQSTINGSHRRMVAERYGSGQLIETCQRTTDLHHANYRLAANANGDSDSVEINRSSGRNEEMLGRQGLIDSKNGLQTPGFNLRHTLQSINNERSLQYVRRELDSDIDLPHLLSVERSSQLIHSNRTILLMHLKLISWLIRLVHRKLPFKPTKVKLSQRRIVILIRDSMENNIVTLISIPTIRMDPLLR